MRRFILAGLMFFFSLIISNNAFSADIDLLANILKKIDGINCTQPEKLPNFYGKNLVILQDDKRLLLENRIKAYRQMMSDFRGINCQVQRQVLTGHVGDKVGYVLSYIPDAPDGHEHVRVRWFHAIPHPNGAPRNVSYSDFRLERFEILSKSDT